MTVSLKLLLKLLSAEPVFSLWLGGVVGGGGGRWREVVLSTVMWQCPLEGAAEQQDRPSSEPRGWSRKREHGV